MEDLAQRRRRGRLVSSFPLRAKGREASGSTKLSAGRRVAKITHPEASACEAGRVVGWTNRLSPSGATHQGFEKTNIHFSGSDQFQPLGCSMYFILLKPHSASPNMTDLVPI